MRVPKEAGLGTAKVTYLFDTWKGREVSPTTVEIPVKKPKTKKENADPDGKKAKTADPSR